MPTDTNTLLNDARCFNCIPDGMQLPVLIHLTAQAAGVSTDPAFLRANAACFSTCIPAGLQLPVLIAILGGLTGGSTPIAPCTTPGTPAIIDGSLFSSQVTIFWMESVDPQTSFIFYWGTHPLGPYNLHSWTLDKSLRTATFDPGMGEFGEPIYGYLVAVSGDCVSPRSNIFTFNVSG